MLTAMARKTSLEIQLRNCDYFVIIPSCSHSIMLDVCYIWIGVRGVKLNTDNERFTVVCSNCHQNRNSGNFTLLFCSRGHGLLLKCVPHVQHAYFSSFDQSNC